MIMIEGQVMNARAWYVDANGNRHDVVSVEPYPVGFGETLLRVGLGPDGRRVWNVPAGSVLVEVRLGVAGQDLRMEMTWPECRDAERRRIKVLAA